MHNALASLKTILEGLSTAIVAGKPDSNTFTASFGWNAPPLTSTQVASLVNQAIQLIDESNLDSLTKEQEQKLSLCQASVQAFQNSTLPYFFNGNVVTAYPNFVGLIQSIRSTLEETIGWQVMPKAHSIPAALARRIESLQISIEKIAVDEKNLSSKIGLINEASDTAEQLPITLKQLNQTKTEIAQ